ncbi:MAG: uroporphyrinogen-III synthase [Muribaculaceae bacterium]|nr:uroporphyrinogen-III synthase [Muribaculaceae bacterium]MDE6486261.1 uroporphyrinogen-III synthase [Muribaculaceae bacterium]
MIIKKILVSQPKPESEKSPYFEIAEKYGVDIVFRPFIKVEGLSAKDFRAQKINIADYTAIIFTAKTAVDNFFRLAEETRVSIPDTQKYFCSSESIANYLQKYIIYRKRKIFASKTGKLADIIPAMVKHKTERYLFAVSDVHNGKDSKLLTDSKVNFTPAVMYRTVSNDFAPDEPFDYDMLVFFSPQGIQSLMKNFPDFKQGDISIATFGATTAAAAQEAGLRIDIGAPTPEAPSMTLAIDKYLAKNQPQE